MTDEPFTPMAGYLQIQVPGIPYSALRVPITGQLDVDSTWVEHAMLIAELARNAYRDAFKDYFVSQEAPEATQPARPVPQNAPRSPQRALGGQRRGGQSDGLDPSLVVNGNCPEHGVPAKPSIAKYNEIEMGENGEERYAKYWHDNPDGTRHSLWARELV